MSDFWKRKIRRFFSTFDFDNDGVITRNDFIGMAARYATFPNIESQKATESDVKAQLEQVWDCYTLSAEIGNRDTLTADVLIDSIGMQRNDTELTKLILAVARNLHDMLDVSRDGYLNEDEYQRIYHQLGVSDPSFVKQAFKAIDVNGDGKLSIEEFMSAFFDFFFSDDEKSPYASFLGPLDN